MPAASRSVISAARQVLFFLFYGDAGLHMRSVSRPCVEAVSPLERDGWRIGGRRVECGQALRFCQAEEAIDGFKNIEKMEGLSRVQTASPNLIFSPSRLKPDYRFCSLNSYKIT